MSRPLVSCLCVTEGRAAFMPWLLWSYERQTYPLRELLVVDSSQLPWEPARRDIQVLGAKRGASVPSKRNQVLAAARGEIVAWFDDDDWQHPERLERLVAALELGAGSAGVQHGFFIDVHTVRAKPYAGPERALFNGAGFTRGVASSVPFNERVLRGSDSVWMRALRAAGHQPRLLGDVTLSAWLCHDRNISNARHKHEFTLEPAQLRGAVGEAAWADTDAQLAKLRRTLETQKRNSHYAAEREVSFAQPLPND